MKVKSYMKNFSLYFFEILLSSLIFAMPTMGKVSADIAEEISQYVEEFVIDQLTENNPDIKAEVIVPDLSKRQRINNCDGELIPELTKKDLTRRSNSVKLTCDDGENSWNAIIPVRIRFTAPAVAIKNAVSKDQTLTSDNLEIIYVDNLTLRGSYFTEPNEIIGSKSKRELSAGSIIKSNQICMVCKDDVVDLEAGTNEVTIKVQGKSLEDGSINSTVRVINLISKKEVKAKVVGVGRVRIDVK